MTTEPPVLQVRNARKLYPVAQGIIGALRRQPRRYVHALDDVSFDLQRGEILGLVGESGSGKTTTALCVMGLTQPSAGEIIIDGRTLADWLKNDQLALRRRVQMIFQDPYEALNPRQTIFDIVAEPLVVHKLARGRGEKAERVRAALNDVGLTPPELYFDRYPQELSGGQRQRVVIAAALVLDPALLVADEPVSMLDVSIRAEILNLLRDLRDRRGISILYITHDLATARFFTDRIAVMYLGRIVEIGGTAQVVAQPSHPYTRALLSVIPVPNPRRRRPRVILQGEVPNPIDLPTGCRFHPRCPDVFGRCSQVDPALYPITEGHEAACLLMIENPAS